MERWGRDSWSAAIKLSATDGHTTHTHTIPHYKRSGLYSTEGKKNPICHEGGFGNGVGTGMTI